MGGLDDDGTRRLNVTQITYSYLGAEYTDTLRYESWIDDGLCHTNGKIGPMQEVSGPLVARWEQATDFPGVKIYLRDL